MAGQRRSLLGCALVLSGAMLAVWSVQSCLGFVAHPGVAGLARSSFRARQEAPTVARAGPTGSPEVEDDAARLLGRRSIGAGALAAVLALAGAGSAQAKLKKDDDYMGDMGKLDGMLKKDFGKALEETKCKTAEEGEKRSFCITKEINERNRKAAEAKGEKYQDQKGTLSKGSYGV
mmetsp:Transcript_12834/g.29106  ORF Transcript_12834/g.29106 Transcript_12834/m.29106 type:complete len:176 (-) Transcript_12834:76-603(-)